MDNLKNKQKKTIKWYIIILYYLLSIILGTIIYISMIFTVKHIFNNKKSEAYTNENIQPYTITDLTNTSWKLNPIINYTTELYFNINYNAYYNDGTGYENGTSLYTTTGNAGVRYYAIGGTGLYSFGNGLNNEFIYFSTGTESMVPITIDKILDYITITGGTDTTNQNLINWLQNNATQLVNEEFYNINYNLQNVLIIGERPTKISNLEEIEIEFQNFNNYELPQNIMIENANYNWNNETGILTIYDATGNVTITVRAEYISGNYSFIELIDSVVLIPLNTFFNLFNFELFGINIYALLTATLTLFVIIKILLKVFK